MKVGISYIYAALYDLFRGMANYAAKIEKKYTHFLLRRLHTAKECVRYTDRVHKDVPFQNVTCVWGLSTGRTGTALLTNICATNPLIRAYHEPLPNAFTFSFDYYNRNVSHECAIEMLAALRDDFVHDASYQGQTYVEMNNRMSYLVPLLQERYPSSKFVFITRHPYEYIISGIKRNWYNGHSCDFARIIPSADDDLLDKPWSEMNQYEQIAWNWARVNLHIMATIKDMSPDVVFQCKAEDIFDSKQEVLDTLCTFIEPRGGWRMSTVQRITNTKVNAQESGQDVLMSQLPKETKECIDNMVGSIARRLGYELSQ